MYSWIAIRRKVFVQATRTTFATVASMLLARTLKLPEFYWAPISTIVILLSPSFPLRLAWERFAGTAFGALLGALIASLFRPNWAVYGASIFVCGLLCALLRVAGAYRFAAITLSIILLVGHHAAAWRVALDRFIEVSLGIAVALLVNIVWPMPTQN